MSMAQKTYLCHRLFLPPRNIKENSCTFTLTKYVDWDRCPMITSWMKLNFSTLTTASYFSDSDTLYTMAVRREPTGNGSLV